MKHDLGAALLAFNALSTTRRVNMPSNPQKIARKAIFDLL
jgi:hypothetical protein